MNSPFDIPLSSLALKRLSAETVKVFQGQQGGQGGSGQGNPCENQKPSRWSILYSDIPNDFYIIQVEEEWGKYRIYEYEGTNPSGKKNIFLQYLRYEAKVASGNMTTSCVQQARANYAMPTGFTKLWPSSGYATQASAPNGDYTGMWEAWKDAHINSFSGCTDSSASNYNPSALTENGSCAWTEDTGLDYNGFLNKKKSSKSDDEFIWETNATVYRKRKAGTTDNNDGTNFNYYGIIEVVKKCTSKAHCGMPVSSAVADRTLSETVISTYSVGTASAPLDWTGLTTGMTTQLTALQNVVDNLASGHTPICREQINTWDWNGNLPQPCDDTYELKVTESLYTCEGTGVNVKKVYKLLKDGVSQGEWTHTFADGSLSDMLLNTTTGNYPWVDSAEQMVNATDSALPLTSSITKQIQVGSGIKRSAISSTGVQDDSYNFFVVWKNNLYKENSCGPLPLESDAFYMDIYPFIAVSTPTSPNPKPTVATTTAAGGNETLVVKFEDVVLTPTETVGPLTQDELTTYRESLYAKVGCMDATATNYNPDANVNAEQKAGHGAACVWDCSEGDGRNLNTTCKSCLPDYEMVWNANTQTWSCIDSAGVVDDVIDGVEEATDNTMLIIAGVVGLIAFAVFGV